jgi:hypothetical protein
MINLVLVTSIIKTPNSALSYINTRSVFTHEERYQQTIKTISTVKKKIPNCKILVVECSKLSEEQNTYFKNNCHFFLNLFDNQEALNKIYSKSKSLGEGTMTICALEYVSERKIYFDNFFKISGRYWLSDNFDYNNFINDNAIVNYYIEGDINYVLTSLYKLHKNHIKDFYEFLCYNQHLMNFISYENIFSEFINSNIDKNKIISLKKIGVNGYIAVSNDYVDS